MAAVRVTMHTRKALEAAYGGGIDGLLKAGAEIKAIADQHVPLGATGKLGDSGVVDEKEGFVRVTYGKSTGAYWGVILHAHPEFHFQSGRRARFLEKGVADTRKIAKAIADGLADSFEKVGG